MFQDFKTAAVTGIAILASSVPVFSDEQEINLSSLYSVVKAGIETPNNDFSAVYPNLTEAVRNDVQHIECVSGDLKGYEKIPSLAILFAKTHFDGKEEPVIVLRGTAFQLCGPQAGSSA